MMTSTQMRRHGLFDARVPRYTSYPTANHFTADVGPEEMAEFLGAVPASERISLYLHIPFCRRLCWFCACRTQGTSTASPVRAYVETLKREIEMMRARLPEGVALSRLHWGGGTPTLLEAETIRDLARAIETSFPLADGAEFSVEIDPNEIDEARLDALAEVGLTRASIGVQDFDPDIQKIIGRDQSFDTTKQAVDGLRARGIDSLNVDILYGLPNQSDARISDSVQRVLSLNPDRIALYGYAHVPWMARRQALIPTDLLPRPEERLALFETAARLFRWDGYMDIGIDHFARPEDGLAVALKEGRLRRNFQGYTDDQAEVLLGLGASSISRFPGGFAQNAPATSKWVGAVEAGMVATARGVVLSRDDALRGVLIEMLMCEFGIDTARAADRAGADPAAVEACLTPLLKSYPDALRKTARGIEVQPEARPLTRILARALDAWDVKSDGHSLAI
ncbi:oxygen-independent coproporphyrinogen III oxidase [Alphaproteobacteria bacterium GH1-50]|uniref:Coproporphyrinogen-III oxidase n=1 Tax=Kangsaoukella pontilimi TaxID=2691042 RepID=A0A7C9MKJ2_9RHOB|nr:oxygen-independent coproporphyrinogen III oxidase [Kangsaoukella pontilimi]MXQ08535.1 oxygen-independent coproporphyrinogen III oxidase [Kangsaoukella pontilimi]